MKGMAMSADGSSITFECKLIVTDNGDMAGLVPANEYDPADMRANGLAFAKTLVTIGAKKYDPAHHNLKVARVPQPAESKRQCDFGIHLTTHLADYHGGPLSDDMVTCIRDCSDTFRIDVDIKKT